MASHYSRLFKSNNVDCDFLCSDFEPCMICREQIQCHKLPPISAWCLCADDGATAINKIMLTDKSVNVIILCFRNFKFIYTCCAFYMHVWMSCHILVRGSTFSNEFYF